MNFKLLSIFVLFFLSLFANEIVLNGNDLTIEEIVAMAKIRPQVRIDPVAMERVIHSHRLLLDAAREDKPVYGLNRGVGLNKDKTLFEGALLNEEAKQASIAFNKRNLRATSAAVGQELPAKVVFPILLIKLNSILHGTTGAQPEAAALLLEMINLGIQPVIPGTGSIGEADITILSHIGLAMIGEGEVYYQGERMPASQAFKLANLKPLLPIAKDSLSIMSSNAYSTALAALLVNDIEQLIDKADAVFSLSLEGLNGNVAPYLEEVQNARPFEGQRISAKNIRYLLEGSYLFSSSSDRELQDPLSFRSISQTHGTVRDQLKRAKADLLLHLKSSDDNPIVQLNPQVIPTGEQEKAYYLQNQDGAVIPTANFETINMTVDFEALAIALSHLSHASVQRMLRLSSEKFTHLSRFLTVDPQAIVFGAAQKSFVALDGEVKALSMPVSRDLVAVAGEVEDLSTNFPFVLQRSCKMIGTIYRILGMELMHAAQAIDLRTRKTPELKLGKLTKDLYERYREHVAFIEDDRPLSSDFEKSYRFLSCQLIYEDCIFKEQNEQKRTKSP